LSIITMPLDGKTAPSWWGCLCDVCFASKKSSDWEFFFPVGTHFGVKLLTALPLWVQRICTHLFNEFLASFITFPNFVL